MIDFNKESKYFLIGIGGISMSSLALILKDNGNEITGSNNVENEMTKNLKNLGFDIKIEHNENNIDSSIDYVIYNNAISEDNPEFIKAKELNIPLLTRSEMFGLLMENYIVFGAPVINASEVANVARTSKSKSQRLLNSLFPNLKHMKLRYSILEKAPVLLPLFWIVRIFEFLFKKKDEIENKKGKISNVDVAGVNIMKDIFEKSGL